MPCFLTASQFWQILHAAKPLSGEVVAFGQPVRLRHAVSGQFMHVVRGGNAVDGACVLLPDEVAASGVFLMHAVVREGPLIIPDSYARIQHKDTGIKRHSQAASF